MAVAFKTKFEDNLGTPVLVRDMPESFYSRGMISSLIAGLAHRRFRRTRSNSQARGGKGSQSLRTTFRDHATGTC